MPHLFPETRVVDDVCLLTPWQPFQHLSKRLLGSSLVRADDGIEALAPQAPCRELGLLDANVVERDVFKSID
jgi:hypothetical protein